MKQPVEVMAELKHETEKAYLVTEGDEEIWIPKSQVENTKIDKNLISFEIPEWLALEKGLI